MPVCLVDIRPFDNAVKGLTVVTGDATELPMFEKDSLGSLSSLHAAEHFGLGRYSDPVDPDACQRFMKTLQRVLAPGGRLYFSVPVGRQRIEFNAHRIFDVRTVLDAFEDLELLSFSFVNDGQLYEDVSPDAAADMDYGCGLFEFTKVKPRSVASASV
jgi:SAM-dependent methyltransferase